MRKKRLRFAKQPPRYLFALNQYADARWSKCPKCKRLTYMRKFPLLMHIDGFALLTLGKTCRYCPKCEFVRAHQNDHEHVMAEMFSEFYPDVVGNEYFVIGTVEKKAWKQGMIQPMKLEDIRDHTRRISKPKWLWDMSLEGGFLPIRIHPKNVGKLMMSGRHGVNPVERSSRFLAGWSRPD